jgi:hypothetical protein
MMIKLRFILLLLLLFIVKPLLAQQAAPMTKEQYRADFGELWKTVHDEYAYWHLKRTDWDSVKRFYLPQLDTVREPHAVHQLPGARAARAVRSSRRPQHEYSFFIPACAFGSGYEGCL